MFGFSKHDSQVSYSHLWMQARRSVSPAYTLPNRHPKIPQITDVYHLPLCLCLYFGQGHCQTRARIHLLWVEASPLVPPGDPQQEIFCRAWSLCVAAVLLDTATTGSSSPFWNFRWGEHLLRGCACLLHLLTSRDTHPLPILLKSLPFPLTKAMPCSQNQQLVANTAKRIMQSLFGFPFFSTSFSF